MKLKNLVRALCVALCEAALFAAGAYASDQPKNVIILIGDGMGPEQVTAGRYYAGAPLSFESLPHQGMVTTYSASVSVTDSAAAATAIATGHKVYNDVISTALPGDGSELQTLLEYYQAALRATGLVTTTFMTHATPAAFGAHVADRDLYDNIASDYLYDTRPDVLFGGGANGMSVAAAQAAGYTVVTDLAGMQALPTDSVSAVSGQFGSTHLPYEYDGLDNLPHLTQMTATALDILEEDPDGFFLMVEGGRIDHAAHDNDINRMAPEVVEFSNAVQQVLDWAAGRTDTLVLVSADHETGGLTVLSDNGPGVVPDVSWSTGSHTGVNVPVYAWGVNAHLVGGTMNNTDFFALATALETPGDADGNGKVDGADLATWQGHYDPLGLSDNNTFLDGDWDHNGRIDGADLALWQANYDPLGLGDSALDGQRPLADVPEPATAALVSAAMLLCAALRRRCA